MQIKIEIPIHAIGGEKTKGFSNTISIVKYPEEPTLFDIDLGDEVLTVKIEDLEKAVKMLKI